MMFIKCRMNVVLLEVVHLCIFKILTISETP